MCATLTEWLSSLPLYSRNHFSCVLLAAADQHPLTTVQKRKLLLVARRFSISATQCRSSLLKAKGFHPCLLIASTIITQQQTMTCCHSIPFFTAEGRRILPTSANCLSAHALLLVSAWKWPFWATMEVQPFPFLHRCRVRASAYP